MLLDSWAPLATGLARYVREFLPDWRRGALPIRLPGGNGQIAVVFGNDGYTSDGRVTHEVAAIRDRLREADLEELGFGLSEDGHAWALLVVPAATQRRTCRTAGGVAPALTSFLDEAVWEAWRRSCGGPQVQPADEGVDHPPRSALPGQALRT